MRDRTPVIGSIDAYTTRFYPRNPLSRNVARRKPITGQQDKLGKVEMVDLCPFSTEDNFQRKTNQIMFCCADEKGGLLVENILSLLNPNPMEGDVCPFSIFVGNPPKICFALQMKGFPVLNPNPMEGGSWKGRRWKGRWGGEWRTRV